MTGFPVGQFYTYGPNFDLYKFLEESAHADHIATTVTDSVASETRAQTLTLIETSSRHAAEEAEARKEQTDLQRKSFEEISEKLADVTDGIYKLDRSVRGVQKSIEAGFVSIGEQLMTNNQTLSELLHVAKTPEETWAREQFRNAKLLFENNIYDEALVCIDRAIEGEGSQLGFKYDHSYYLLRGLIRLGNRLNFREPVVSLSEAQSNFLLAAKYTLPRGKVSEREIASAKGQAYALHAWASYCIGDPQLAINSYRTAVQLDPRETKNRFFLGKVLFHAKQLAEGAGELEHCLRADVAFEELARSDGDYMSEQGRITETVNSLRNEYREKLTSDFDNILHVLKDPKLSPSSEQTLKERHRQSYMKLGDLVEGNRPGRKDSLVALRDKHTRIQGVVSDLNATVQSMKSATQSKVDELELKRKEKLDQAARRSADVENKLVAGQAASIANLQEQKANSYRWKVAFWGISTHTLAFLFVLLPWAATELGRSPLDFVRDIPNDPLGAFKVFALGAVLTSPAWGFSLWVAERHYADKAKSEGKAEATRISQAKTSEINQSKEKNSLSIRKRFEEEVAPYRALLAKLNKLHFSVRKSLN